MDSRTVVSAADAAGVKAFLTAWVKAWNAHDAEAILQLHAEDCATVNRVGLFFASREALRPQMEFLQSKVFKAAQFPEFEVMHQRLLAPGLVVVQAKWPQLTSMMPPPWPKVGDMIFTFVLRKGADGWLAEEVDTHDVIPPPKQGE